MDRKEATKLTLKMSGIDKPSKLFTRLGQAEKFIEEQPLFYDKSKLWWYWNKKKFMWEIVDETDVLNSISKSLDIDTINSKAKIEILESLKQVGRLNIPKPIKPTWVQFKDKIVDIKTGEEFEATPKYFVTNPIPYPLHNKRHVETPVIDQIFEEWVGKDYIKTLYEIIAYCLLPTYPLHRVFCFIGSGMNGKSCFLGLLRKFIGEENCCSTELDTLINSRFEVTRLHKKLMCQMGETNFSEMSKTSMLKKLSGGDLIGFEYKNKNPFEDINYAKIIIATNNLPTTTDKTIGFYRRWLIIDFPNRFSEKKDILDDIPEEEYEILAVKSLIILKELLEKREFHNEGDVEDRMKKYEDKSDFFGAFLNDNIKYNSNEFITKYDFYKKFTSWCRERGYRLLAENTIGRKMKELGIETVRKIPPFYDKQVRVWEGIQWK
jgi:putative DNA primase/helicase